MYGHITTDGTVGQLFDQLPPSGQYHESFISAIVELPPGATTGWIADGVGSFRAPGPPDQAGGGAFGPDEPGGTLADLAARVEELSAQVEALKGVMAP